MYVKKLHVLLAGLIAVGLPESSIAIKAPVSHVPSLGFLLSAALLVTHVQAGHAAPSDEESQSLLRGLHHKAAPPAELLEATGAATFGAALLEAFRQDNNEHEASDLQANSSKSFGATVSVVSSGEPQSTLLRGHRGLGVGSDTDDCGGRGRCTNFASCVADVCQCDVGSIPNPEITPIEDAGWFSCLDVDECLDKENPVCAGEHMDCVDYNPPERYKCICPEGKLLSSRFSRYERIHGKLEIMLSTHELECMQLHRDSAF